MTNLFIKSRHKWAQNFFHYFDLYTRCQAGHAAPRRATPGPTAAPLELDNIVRYFDLLSPCIDFYLQIFNVTADCVFWIGQQQQQ